MLYFLNITTFTSILMQQSILGTHEVQLSPEQMQCNNKIITIK